MDERRVLKEWGKCGGEISDKGARTERKQMDFFLIYI
jgi:hypothetical protein